MKDKGQILEIPASSPLYNDEVLNFLTKKEELIWYSTPKRYDLFDGILIGGHQGIENFKLGQRKKISSGGHQLPLYVISIDQNENRIFVGAGNNHPGLLVKALRIFKKNLQLEDTDTFFLNNNFEPVVVKVYFDEEYLLDNVKLYYHKEELFLEFPESINIYKYKKTSIYHNETFLATINI